MKFWKHVLSTYWLIHWWKKLSLVVITTWNLFICFVLRITHARKAKLPLLSSNKACKWFALSIYRIGNGMFSPFSQLHSCNALDRASHTSRRHFAALFLSFQMSALTVHPKYSIWFSVYRVITNLSSLLYHVSNSWMFMDENVSTLLKVLLLESMFTMDWSGLSSRLLVRGYFFLNSQDH